MLCNSCNKQKAHLNKRQSTIMPGITLYLCDTCIEAKYEPRWVIILAGRQGGPAKVRDFIVKQRYHGEPIIAAELIV